MNIHETCNKITSPGDTRSLPEKIRELTGLYFLTKPTEHRDRTLIVLAIETLATDALLIR